MRHRSKKKTLGRKAPARKALVRDLVTAVVTYDKIETTLGKAKYIRPVVDKVITTAKRGDLAARRNLLAFFTTEQPVNKLMDVLGPRFKERNGGYTRMTKLGIRQGDAAEAVIIEFV
ncbi:MAG: 50S ribosomal protein L17 [Candidatus Uhrbacteria bacterium GW2011_GWD2_52_7]|uniref:Large ribosomal subunit protein bL17 n=1 Tax=Candidatus Uhrbacteria bacterium GW2011_GWD2_52_7 TaxID=1618989 RepID=A0A0G2ABA8_9BACT|nr:MAG: 50S ribosomal protein L17 [Candidatus Uhrbacteria bacterium GW2011_GWD2_52_7]